MSGDAALPEPVDPGCEHALDPADLLSAPAFQRHVLSRLDAVEGMTIEAVSPFRVRLGWRGEKFDVRLDGMFKRYRHGEILPDEAAEEVKAALGVPGASATRHGPFPRLMPRTAAPAGVYRAACPFDPELVVTFVWGLPEGHVAISAGEAARTWAVDEDGGAALWAEALEALRARTQAVPAAGSGEGERLVIRYEAGDGLDAAAVLLPDLVATAAGWVHGGVLVGIPSRDELLIAGDADADFVEELREQVAARYAEAAEPVSPRLYRAEAAGGETEDVADA